MIRVFLMKNRIVFFILLFFLFLSSCISNPPLEEYTLARTALNAARLVESARYASSLWHQAEESYQKGQKAFHKEDYEKALQYFIQARSYAEKAENITRVVRFQRGEGF